MTSEPASSSRAAEVTLLTQSDCALCEQAKNILTRLVDERFVTVREVDLADPEGRDQAIRHGVLFAPGVLVDGQPFSYGRLSEKKLRRHLARITTAEQAASADLPAQAARAATEPPAAPFPRGPSC